MSKAIVVLSGGMDSAVLLAQTVIAHQGNVETLTFNYGSKHNDQENSAAFLLSHHYHVHNRLVALPFINDIFKSDLLRSGGDVPEGHYADEVMKRTVVPNRNAIMLSIAVGYAESVGAEFVYFGAHAGDHAIYPDCRPAFVEAFDRVSVLGTFSGVHVSAPFVSITKADIVREGARLGVPFGFTYSCYRGGELHCGKCGTCFERKEAFQLAGVPDPTQYA